MANIKSAIKRIDIAKRNSEHNKPIRTEMKTAVKNFRTALDEERIDKDIRDLKDKLNIK